MEYVEVPSCGCEAHLLRGLATVHLAHSEIWLCVTYTLQLIIVTIAELCCM